jgi:hypothetical protein
VNTPVRHSLSVNLITINSSKREEGTNGVVDELEAEEEEEGQEEGGGGRREEGGGGGGGNVRYFFSKSDGREPKRERERDSMSCEHTNDTSCQL